MHKNIRVILFSCLIGSILAGAFFLNVKDKASAKNRPLVYVFQVGVFKNEQNAINLTNKYSFSKIVKDNDYYRVFIGATVNNKDILMNYFKDNEINYYLKEIAVSEIIQSELIKYDEVLKSSNELELVMSKMLECLPDEL